MRCAFVKALHLANKKWIPELSIAPCRRKGSQLWQAQGPWGWFGGKPTFQCCPFWLKYREEGAQERSGPGLQREWVTNGVRHFLFLQVHYSPQNFTDNIQKALDILHAEVQRLGHMVSKQLNHSPPWASDSLEVALALVEASLLGPLCLETSTDHAVSPGLSGLNT